jgi:TatD DNase family protein
MKLFDSHCHLDDRSYQKDFASVLDRARKAGVEKIMVVGTTHKSSHEVVSIAETHEDLYASIGIHPHDAKDCSEEKLQSVRTLAKSKKVRAWGEIGLDFNRMYSSRVDQEKWLVGQLEIADDLDLPIIFHERDSNGRLLEILNAGTDKERKGVVHCFSGDRNELEQYLELGLNIGITGILTHKERGKSLRDLIQYIPQTRILVETDAPYLTPTPERNKFRRNEPAFVRSVFLKLVEVLDADPESLAETIWDNTCRLFHIDNPSL